MNNTIAFGTAYIFTISCLYLVGYWGHFNVNPFEYISVSQLGVISIYSLASTFGGIFIGIFINGIYLNKYFPVGGGRDTSVGKSLNRYWKMLYLPFVVIIYYTLFRNNPLSALIIGLLVFPVIFITTANSGIMNNIIKNDELRFSIIAILVLILCLAAGKGQLDATFLSTNKTKNVELDNKKYIYLGKLDQNIFLYDSDINVIEIIENKNIKLKFTINHKKHKTTNKKN